MAAPTFVSNYFKEWRTLNKIRIKISDEHLDNSLRTETTSIEPDNNAFVPHLSSYRVALFYFTFIAENTKKKSVTFYDLNMFTLLLAIAN